jgi:hypothetical protein
MGKVTNTHDKPTKGAILTIEIPGEKAYAVSDEHGLYYFKHLLPAGTYPVAIESKHYVSHALCTIAADSTKVRFYNFSIDGPNALVIVSENDPFAEVAMEKVKKQPATLDGKPGSTYMIKLKDTGAISKTADTVMH